MANATNKAAQAAQAPSKHTIASAGTVASGTAQGKTVAGLAVTATGAIGGRKQKLVYQYGTATLRLVTSKATGTALKAYLVTLQAAMPNGKALAAQTILANLQANKVANPKRVMRRSQRAGMLV